MVVHRKAEDGCLSGDFHGCTRRGKVVKVPDLGKGSRGYRLGGQAGNQAQKQMARASARACVCTVWESGSEGVSVGMLFCKFKVVVMWTGLQCGEGLELRPCNAERQEVRWREALEWGRGDARRRNADEVLGTWDGARCPGVQFRRRVTLHVLGALLCFSPGGLLCLGSGRKAGPQPAL